MWLQLEKNEKEGWGFALGAHKGGVEAEARKQKKRRKGGDLRWARTEKIGFEASEQERLGIRSWGTQRKGLVEAQEQEKRQKSGSSPACTQRKWWG